MIDRDPDASIRDLTEQVNELTRLARETDYTERDRRRAIAAELRQTAELARDAGADELAERAELNANAVEPGTRADGKPTGQQDTGPATGMKAAEQHDRDCRNHPTPGRDNPPEPGDPTFPAGV